MRVVGEAENGSLAVEKTLALAPDVVIMDIKMPELDGISAAKQIRSKLPKIGIVILTTFEEEKDIIECMRVGVNSYLLKHAHPTDLIKAVRGVLKDESMIDPRVASKVVSRFPEAVSPTSSEEIYQDFTPREVEVLKMIGLGLNDSEIAMKLVISPKTVRTHVSNIYLKLGVSSRTKAALHALHHGLIQLEE